MLHHDDAVVPHQAIRRPLAVAGSILIILLCVLALFPSAIAPYDPIKIELSDRLQPPGSANWFGTDSFGRDLFSRVIFGVRISLLTSVTVVTGAAVVGTSLGVLSGYLGGWVDEVLMRVTDVFMAIPVILLAMVVVVVLKPGLINTMIALIVVWWPVYARLMRSQVITIKERPYVEAAVAFGAGSWKVTVRHIVPNALAPILVQCTMDMGYVVLTGAALGFMGLGAQPPMPEWGKMISSGRAYFLDAWWYPVFPGFAIASTVMIFNLLGDYLRDWMDPKSRVI
jgi:peptide/nickel transport system permease protein|tara:strand:- start:2568 stop:3416 length:849 start_codon:yes stop_codon:yes gene_type:complete